MCQQTLDYQWISAFMGVQMSVYRCTNVSLWVYKCQFMGVQMSVYGCTNFKKYLIKIFVV